MSWISREFQFSKSQAEREFNCPLYKSYVRAAKTAKGTKWQRDPRKKLLSKFTLLKNPCERTFLFCNREKAKGFFENNWARRETPKPSVKAEQAPVRNRTDDLKENSTLKITSVVVGSSLRKIVVSQRGDLSLWPSSLNQVQDKAKKIGIFIRAFK